jgi:hypothetical protein
MRIYFKLNANLHGYKAGTIISTPACSSGIPLAKKWRKRFIEAEKDNCILIIKKPSKDVKNKAVTG